MSIENDKEYHEITIKGVRDAGDDWAITRDDGFSLLVPKTNDLKYYKPRTGDVMRSYGKGVGYPVRGITINGRLGFYRNPREDREYQDKDLYGSSCEEWLSRWDAGKIVWSIEMGGLGPGYEQAIQITVAELLRVMIGQNYDPSQWTDQTIFTEHRNNIEMLLRDSEVVSKLELSGAQYSAAFGLASELFRKGPVKVLTEFNKVDENDRLIQVCKNFPGC